MDTGIIISIMFFGGGIYILILILQMSASGRINSMVLPDEDIKKCKDEKGYIRAVAPYMFTFSILGIVTGIAGFLAKLHVLPDSIWLYRCIYAIFLIGVVFFVYGTRKARERFL